MPIYVHNQYHVLEMVFNVQTFKWTKQVDKHYTVK